MNALKWVWVGIFGVVIVWILFFSWFFLRSLWNPGQSSSALRMSALTNHAPQIVPQQVTPEVMALINPKGSEPSFGNPAAKIRIVEFVDYQCPFTREMAPILRAVMQRHAKDVFFVLRDFPISEIHPRAEPVAHAARCVWLQGRADVFWKFHDRVFASQEKLSDDDLRQYAQQVGVVLTAYDQCALSQEPLQHIARSLHDGKDAGVVGTPTFFINDKKIEGTIDEAQLEALLKDL